MVNTKLGTEPEGIQAERARAHNDGAPPELRGVAAGADDEGAGVELIVEDGALEATLAEAAAARAAPAAPVARVDDEVEVGPPPLVVLGDVPLEREWPVPMHDPMRVHREAPPLVDLVAAVERLVRLRDAGEITNDEFLRRRIAVLRLV